MKKTNHIFETVAQLNRIFVIRDKIDTPNTIQLMTFDELNTGIHQPMEHGIHRGIRGLINPCIH
jgi:hypothetical protein